MTASVGKSRGRGSSKRKVAYDPAADSVERVEPLEYLDMEGNSHTLHIASEDFTDHDDDDDEEEEDGEDDIFFNVRGALEAAGASSANKMKMIQQEEEQPAPLLLPETTVAAPSPDSPTKDETIRQLQARIDQLEQSNKDLQVKYAKLESDMTADKEKKLENDFQSFKKKTISAKAELQRAISGLKEQIVTLEGTIIDLKESVELLQS